MFKLILCAGLISVLAACSSMSRDSTSARTPSGAATMGAPGGIGSDYGPNGTYYGGGPN
jgi:hypothetical protein